MSLAISPMPPELLVIHRFRFSALTAVALTLFACEQSSRTTDSSEEALEATWFATNLPEGSDIAHAALALVNDRGMSADDYTSKVSISRAAALAITNYRDGDDVTSTQDDQIFDTLGELDSLPFTDLGFWNAIAAYAKAHPVAPSCATNGPVAMEIVLDASGSMSEPGKWDGTAAALGAFLDGVHQEVNPNLAIGLMLLQQESGSPVFPKPTDVAPDFVGDAQYHLLRQRVENGKPSGGTPTFEAMTAAYGLMSAYAPSAPIPAGAKRVVVLISDGVPNTSPSDVIKSTAAAATADPTIKTFAIGIGEFPKQAGYDPKFMGEVAKAGGTAASPSCNPGSYDLSNICHLQVTPTGDASKTKTDLLAALATVRQRASCLP